MAEASSTMWEIDADCHITRRKHMSHVYDNQGDIRFSHSRLSACIAYLFEQGQSEFRIHCEEAEIYLEIKDVNQFLAHET